MIANLKGIRLSHREVQVSFGADVRGTLMTCDNVPVRFQIAHMKGRFENGVWLVKAASKRVDRRSWRELRHFTNSACSTSCQN